MQGRHQKLFAAWMNEQTCQVHGGGTPWCFLCHRIHRQWYFSGPWRNGEGFQDGGVLPGGKATPAPSPPVYWPQKVTLSGRLVLPALFCPS